VSLAHQFYYYQSFLPIDQSRVKNLNLALLEEPDDTRMHQDCPGMAPLHDLACSVQPNLKLCQVLVHRRPADIITTDKWGDLPTDYAGYCHASREIVQFLLECHEIFFPKHKLDWAKMVVPCQYSGRCRLSSSCWKHRGLPLSRSRTRLAGNK
jgi:hypothetical protein